MEMRTGQRRARLLLVLLTAVLAWSLRGVEFLAHSEDAGPVGRVARRASALHDANGAYRGARAPVPWPATAGPSKRVLFIGIDGLRSDALEQAQAPALHALIEHGTYSPDALVRPADQIFAATSSGPGWTSILTGVWPSLHGVQDNGFEGNRLAEHPSVFEMLAPRWTGSLSNWPPVNKLLGPKATLAPLVESEPESYELADRALTQSALTILSTLEPELLFVMYGSVDAAGHNKGFRLDGKPYMDAIAFADQQVGALLTGLHARRSVAQEDWLVIVTSDHGGQGHGHGFLENPPVSVARTALIVSGPSCRKGLWPEETALVDVVPTILAHLRAPARASWKLAGRPVGLKQN